MSRHLPSARASLLAATLIAAAACTPTPPGADAGDAGSSGEDLLDASSPDASTLDAGSLDAGAADASTPVDGGEPEEATATVGAGGGSVVTSSGAAVEVPAGALGSDVTVTVGSIPADDLSAPVPTAMALRGAPQRFTPHGTTFATPVTLRIPYAGAANVVLRLDDESDTTWEAVSGVSFEDGVATFTTTTFSVYAVAETTDRYRLVCAYWDGSDEQVVEIDPDSGERTSRGVLGDLGWWSGSLVLNPQGTHVYATGYPTDAEDRRIPCRATGETLDGGPTPDDSGAPTDAGASDGGADMDGGSITHISGASVSLGTAHGCVIEVDGDVVCWGANDSGQTQPPPGTFVQVSAGLGQTCGVRSDGAAVCWGNNLGGQSSAPAGSFTQVAAARTFSCGLLTDGSATCWGFNEPQPVGTFTSLVGGGLHVCGLRSDGSAACWGGELYGLPDAPAGTFTALGLGSSDHACGIRPSGEVDCWGSNEFGQSTPPAGTFTTVAVGTRHTCGIRPGGLVECWGSDEDGQSTPPAGLVATAVAAGGAHSCALRELSGEVVCWGLDTSGQSSPFVVNSPPDAGPTDAGGDPGEGAIVGDSCLYSLDLETGVSRQVPVPHPYKLAGVTREGTLIGLYREEREGEVSVGVEVAVIDPATGAQTPAGSFPSLYGWIDLSPALDRERGRVYTLGTEGEESPVSLYALDLTTGTASRVSLSVEVPTTPTGVRLDGLLVGPRIPRIATLDPVTGSIQDFAEVPLDALSSEASYDPFRNVLYGWGSNDISGESVSYMYQYSFGASAVQTRQEEACTLARY